MRAKIRNNRVVIVALLFLATVISYIDRQVLSVNAPIIREELGLSNVDYSRIVFSFLLAYTFMLAGSGWLMDRWGTRRGFILPNLIILTRRTLPHSPIVPPPQYARLFSSRN